MTTTTKKNAGPLRIRAELLPDTAKYATIDDVEYVMIPVADFAEWYEDVEDGAIVRYARDNPTPLIPADEVHAGSWNPAQGQPVKYRIGYREVAARQLRNTGKISIDEKAATHSGCGI